MSRRMDPHAPPGHDGAATAPHRRRAAAEALYSTGHWLLGRERLADAADVFRLMLQLVPEDERGWLGLASAHERLRQPDIALELLRAACEATPPALRCRQARCRLLHRAGAWRSLERERSELEHLLRRHHPTTLAEDATVP